MKILMIDNEVQKMAPMRAILELYGFDVAFNRTVDGGMEYICQNADSIDLILLDAMMPNGSFLADTDTRGGRETGLHLYKEIRKIFHGPIIIYTVLRNKKLVMSFIGTDKKAAYLTKPQDPEDVVKKIYELCG